MTDALNTSIVMALCALAALRPPLPKRSTPFNIQFALGYLLNEQPFLGMWLLLSGSTTLWLQPRPDRPIWWVSCGLGVLAASGLIAIAVRAGSARAALSAAFEDVYGPGAAARYTRPAWWRIALLPFVSWRPEVRKHRNLRYGPARRGHRLDVYAARKRRRADTPVLIYLHGGGFRMGSKMIGAHPLLYRLASLGWVCISADYRLSRVSYPDQVADVRAVLHWVRQNAPAYGGNPRHLFLAGGSAGAHLAATTALTDAEVSGVIGFYGYYGNAGGPGPAPASPRAHIHAGAPPFLIVHGSLDTLALARDARDFAGHLREASKQPVVYAELPGTQHNFDFFQSRRFHIITDAVVRFAEITLSGQSSADPDDRLADGLTAEHL